MPVWRHRAGKRKASPFSKGEPKEDPKRPGRKSGEAHGRHGRTNSASWPGRQGCPSAEFLPGRGGGEVEHERDKEGQWQVDVGELKPVTTRFRVQVGQGTTAPASRQRHASPGNAPPGAAPPPTVNAGDQPVPARPQRPGNGLGRRKGGQGRGAEEACRLWDEISSAHANDKLGFFGR